MVYATTPRASLTHMPWKPKPAITLEREKHELQMRLLKVNTELRLKCIYAERLECLLRQRNKRIDQLFGLLEQARITNHRLERECEHLAHLIATPQPPCSPKRLTASNRAIAVAMLSKFTFLLGRTAPLDCPASGTRLRRRSRPGTQVPVRQAS
jgi:hypothetical protein